MARTVVFRLVSGEQLAVDHRIVHAAFQRWPFLRRLVLARGVKGAWGFAAFWGSGCQGLRGLGFRVSG